MVSENRKRASAVIVKDNKLLLIKRIKPERVYFMFPGGGVEEGETVEQGLRREVKEELTLDVTSANPVAVFKNIEVPVWATIHNRLQDFYYFLVECEGIPEIGGPEKESMGKENMYELVWMTLPEVQLLQNLYPPEGLSELFEKLNFV